MKQILFFIILILVVSGSFAQMSIGQINSDSDIIVFIRQQNYSKDAPQWNHFYLTNGTEWHNYFNLNVRQNELTGRLVNLQSWKKADINNDGKMDLIVSGYIASQPGDWSTAVFKVLVFLATGKKNNYDKLNLLTDDIDRYPAYFEIITLNDRNLMQLCYSKNMNASKDEQPISVDTLQYNSFVKNFINYSNKPYPKAIQKVDYLVKDATSEAYHCVTLEKKQSGKCFVTYFAKDAGSNSIETHTLKIRNDYFQSLDSLVRQYTVENSEIVISNEDDTSSSPVVTTIVYNDGSRKIIRDYGGVNNYTLLAIYQVMENSMQTVVNKIENRNEFWGGFVGGVAGSLL